MLYYHKINGKKRHLKNWKIEGKPCWNYRNPHLQNNCTSTQAVASPLLFKSRNIILAAVKHDWKFILWLYGDSKNTALAC